MSFFDDIARGVDGLKKELLDLQQENRYLRFKNTVYSIVLRLNSINIDEYYSENENGIKVKNVDIKELTIFLDGEEKKYKFKYPKGSVKQDSTKEEKKIIETKKKLDEMVIQNNLDVSLQESKDAIKQHMNNLITTRAPKKTLEALREVRNRTIGKMELSEYILALKNDYESIKRILTEKKYENKRVEECINIGFSSLDKRLIFIGKYYDSTLTQEEIKRFQVCLDVNANHPTRYVPFSLENLCKKVCNYSLAIFSVKMNISRYVNNPNGFSNMVCLKDNDTEDVFQFYVLDNESKGKRNWRMENRLLQLSDDMRKEILDYCVIIFRRIYKDIYSDNIYREDYRDRVEICKADLEMLISNIVTLSKRKEFCLLLQSIVNENNFVPEEGVDRINLKSDDAVVRNQFRDKNNERLSREGVSSSISRLFDDLSDDDKSKMVEYANKLV